NGNGRIAQPVQSICLTSRGSAVRIRVRPQISHLRVAFVFMAYTYILYSLTLDRFYIGHTGLTLEERMRRHLSDHDGFTGKVKDWELVWSRSTASEEEAYALERTIKSWKSRQRIQRLIEEG